MAKKILRLVAVVALLCLTGWGCFKEEPLKLPFTGYAPPRMDDGWTVGTPASVGLDGDALTAVYSDYHNRRDLWQVRSLLVFRHGRLVAESYTKDTADRTRPVAVWSCTKQVMAILTGMALTDGLLHDVADPVSAYLPSVLEEHPDKAGLTLAHLLTMQSGIGFDNGGLNGGSNRLLKQIPENSLEFVLGLPLRHVPGETFHYSDGDPQILSAVLQAGAGRTVRDWAREVLFDGLGVCRYDWITYRDGLTMGAFGLLLTPRDLARFGQLVLDGGRWNGVRLVDSVWIREMTSVKVSADETTYHGVAFGYYWWIDEARGVVFMNGQGGQFVFVVPDKSLVVVMTAEPNTQGRHQFQVTDALGLVDRIVACVAPDSLDV